MDSDLSFAFLIQDSCLLKDAEAKLLVRLLRQLRTPTWLWSGRHMTGGGYSSRQVLYEEKKENPSLNCEK
jgi:hypothetical protein